jgi:hypothetical protein
MTFNICDICEKVEVFYNSTKSSDSILVLTDKNLDNFSVTVIKKPNYKETLFYVLDKIMLYISGIRIHNYNNKSEQVYGSQNHNNVINKIIHDHLMNHLESNNMNNSNIIVKIK